MVLIDALYINNGGGKVLLEYLIDEVEKTDLNVCYLFDSRLSINYDRIKKSNSIQILEASLYKRHLFYKRHKKTFSDIFCFGNLPPSLKLSATVYTYFHNTIYLKVPKKFRLLDRLKYVIKISVIRALKRNCDYWVVQTSTVQIRLKLKFEITSPILVIPFYPQIKKTDSSKSKISNTYIYVSNAQSNKNHKKLIDAFCKFYDKCGIGNLTLTVDSSFLDICSHILEKQDKGYPVTNLGFVTKDILASHYSVSEFVIYPSVSESFGLGIIEGLNFGCKIIGAALPYTYAVCEPSLTFNPEIEESIVEAFQKSLGITPPSKLLVESEIEKIVNLLNGK